MQLLTAKFAQIASEIDTTNAQITTLQTKLGDLQEFQQQLLSVEQACTSALSQVDTALMMLNHVDPTQVEIFQNALTAKFNTEAIGLIQPSAPATPEPALEPTTPDAPLPAETEAVIDIQATVTPEPTTPTEPEPAPDMDIEKELANMPLPLLRSLAKSKKVDGRGSAANITRRLKTLITNADLRALA